MTPFILFLSLFCTLKRKGLLERRWHVMLNCLLQIFHSNQIPTQRSSPQTRPSLLKTSRTQSQSLTSTVGRVVIRISPTLVSHLHTLQHPPTRTFKTRGSQWTGIHPSLLPPNPPLHTPISHPIRPVVVWRQDRWIPSLATLITHFSELHPQNSELLR